MQMQNKPELTALLAQSLLNIGNGSNSVHYDPCELAVQVKGHYDPNPNPNPIPSPNPSPNPGPNQVKEALREPQPLRKWQTVIAYQNACLNASHELDNESEAFYMTPG